jgi:thiosulfate dehydrogenase [quinone] large subunit
MEQNKIHYVWGLLRIGMGWIFFWAFIDKLFGLGFATAPDKAWLAGGSPTFGFLNFAVKGPFAEFYRGLAGNLVVDWLFMMGLLLVGLALMLGIGVRIAGYAGALMMILMYSAGFLPPAHNPFLDDHLIYAMLLVGFAMSKSGDYLGFGKRWSQTRIVEKYPILQ